MKNLYPLQMTNLFLRGKIETHSTLTTNSHLSLLLEMHNKLKSILLLSFILTCLLLFSNVSLSAKDIESPFDHTIKTELYVDFSDFLSLENWDIKTRQSLSFNALQSCLQDMTNTDPRLVSCKLDRKNNSMELKFQDLEISSSNVEITLRSNTGERLVLTANNYDEGDEVFIVSLKNGQFKDARSITVTSFYIDVFTNPKKISLEVNNSKITTL